MKNLILIFLVATISTAFADTAPVRQQYYDKMFENLQDTRMYHSEHTPFDCRNTDSWPMSLVGAKLSILTDDLSGFACKLSTDPDFSADAQGGLSHIPSLEIAEVREYEHNGVYLVFNDPRDKIYYLNCPNGFLMSKGSIYTVLNISCPKNVHHNETEQPGGLK
jgi:hypothetical protein